MFLIVKNQQQQHSHHIRTFNAKFQRMQCHLLVVFLLSTRMADAIHPISSYTTMSKQIHKRYDDFNFSSSQAPSSFSTSSSNVRKQRLRQALVNLEQRKPQEHEALSPSTESPITTTMYINYYQNNEDASASLDNLMNPPTTSIFTSLGGEDDDNNNNNNNTPNRHTPLRAWKTIVWFVLGAICTIPFTEFVFDPVVLMWAMAFFGWLSYEEYDYPMAEDEQVHYPGCTDRQYFMTEEEEQAEENRYQQIRQHLPFDARCATSPPRGGNTRIPRVSKRLRRRSITFFGIEAGMIVVGDWLVRLLVPKNMIPSWIDIVSVPTLVISIICSIVVQFRIQQYQFEKTILSTLPSTSAGSRRQPQPQHPIPYWAGYYMDHLAILLPIALLAFEFLFESNWLWNCLTRVFSRHVGIDNHGMFEPFLMHRGLP